MAKTTYRELVRAHIRSDKETAAAMNDQIPPEERNDFHLFLGAVFAVMLQERLGERPGYDDIHGLVVEMEQDYRNAEPPIKPLLVEGTIRALYGEDHLLDDIPPGESIRAQFLVIGKIAVQSDAVMADLDKYLDAAEKLAAQWAED